MLIPTKKIWCVSSLSYYVILKAVNNMVNVNEIWTILEFTIDCIAPCNIFKLVKVMHLTLMWSSCCNNHQGLYMCQNYRAFNGMQGDVSVTMETNDIIPPQFRPSHISHFTSSLQCIWHPDGCDMQIPWIGGCHSWDKNSNVKQINPFTIQPKITGRIYVRLISNFLKC